MYTECFFNHVKSSNKQKTMKQILFYVSILCLIALPEKGWSQQLDEEINPRNALINIGVKAGGGLSQFSRPGSVMTGNIGAFGRYQALPYLQVQFDLQYDVFGGSRTDLARDLNLFNVGGNSFSDAGIAVLEYQNRQVFMHAANAQLSARLSLPELNNAAIQPKLIVGASSAYIFRARENHDSYFIFNDGTRVILSNEWEEVGGDYKTVNLAAHAGFALDFNLPNKEVFSLEFIYQRGFTDLNDVQSGQPENIVGDLNAHRFGINFSYSFLELRLK